MAYAEFQYCDSFDITSEVKETFEEKGYIILRGLLDSDEVDKLKKAVDDTDAITKHTQKIPDKESKITRMSIWRHPGNDVTGMIARCEKVAGFSEKLLGGEVYHYHGKLMMKDAQTGGRFVWHQDYGYWYKNGILFPDLLSVFMPVDKCVQKNGCLEILEGSHLCGRIAHLMVAGQTGADMERVNEIKKVCRHKYVELESGARKIIPLFGVKQMKYEQKLILTSLIEKKDCIATLQTEFGDALFFHSNLLHSSGINNSDMRRWALVSCYNKASNNPVIKHECPQYTKLHKVPNSAIKECNNITDVEEKEFIDLRKDKNVRVDDSDDSK